MGIKSINNLASSFLNLWASTGKEAALASASGGNISGLEPGNGYTYHVFTGPGSLDVTGEGFSNVEIVVVGGGGGGGGGNCAPLDSAPFTCGGAGGGAGCVTKTIIPTLTEGSYSVSIAAGGGGGGGYSPTAPSRPQAEGGDSKFAPGTPVAVEAGGGGSGGGGNSKFGSSGVWEGSPDQTGKGGSGGGHCFDGSGPASSDGGGNANPGGRASSSPTNKTIGGGGGAAGAGNPGPGEGSNGGSGPGGAGYATGTGFAGSLFPTMPTDWKDAVGPTGLFGGGGGGGFVKADDSYGDSDYPACIGTGGPGGGGRGGHGAPTIFPASPGAIASVQGVDGTGGGGGGGSASGSVPGGAWPESGPNPGPNAGSPGGKGICIVRYQPG